MPAYTPFGDTVFQKAIWLMEARGLLVTAKGLRRTIAYATDLQGTGSIIVPLLGNLQANDKVKGEVVTFQENPNTFATVTPNIHKDVSYIVDKMDKVQSSVDLRLGNINAIIAAVELAKDQDIIAALEAMSFPAGHTVTVPTIDLADSDDAAGTKVERGLRRAKAILSAKGVSPLNRWVLGHSFAVDTWMGADKVVSRDYNAGEAPLVTGAIGTRHGANIVEHGELALTWDGGSPGETTSSVFFYNSDILAMGEWEVFDLNSSYREEWTGWPVVADTIYGVETARDTCAVEVALTWEGNPFGLPAP